jgi:signal transduction histidine kinase
MVDALLGNVFAHTGEGDAFSVRLDHDRESVRLSVEDAGPGFPAGPVLERGQSGGASTGLGLDIARRTAEAVGGSIAIGPGPRLGGAVVAVAVPVSGGDRDAAGAGRGRSRAS